jgi:hypothetical protein
LARPFESASGSAGVRDPIHAAGLIAIILDYPPSAACVPGVRVIGGRSQIAHSHFGAVPLEWPGGHLVGEDLVALHEHLMRRGFVVAAHDREENGGSYTIVLYGIGEKPIRERVERLLQLGLRGDGR